MADIIDYLKWRGDISFSDLHLNEIDSLVFSLLTYIDYDKILNEADGDVTVKQAAEKILGDGKKKLPRLGFIIPQKIYNVLDAASKTERFENVVLCSYVNTVNIEDQTQFSALTFILPDNSIVVAYRGTDDTVIGWREDFNLSWSPRVPGQVMSAEYLDTQGYRFEGKQIYVTGHSKGGNFAMFASAFCKGDIQERIVKVYSHDGPGFSKEIIKSDGYRHIRDRIVALIPQSSLVGLLLDHDCEYTIVKSSLVNVFQHNGLSWDLCGSKFTRCDKLSPAGVKNDTKIRERIEKMTIPERERFVENMFKVLDSTGAKTLTEIAAGGVVSMAKMIKAVSTMEESERETAKYLITKFFDIKQKPTKKTTIQRIDNGKQKERKTNNSPKQKSTT